MLPIISYCTV